MQLFAVEHSESCVMTPCSLGAGSQLQDCGSLTVGAVVEEEDGSAAR
jgi:hypothetical protein